MMTRKMFTVKLVVEHGSWIASRLHSKSLADVVPCTHVSLATIKSSAGATGADPLPLPFEKEDEFEPQKACAAMAARKRRPSSDSSLFWDILSF